MLTDDGFLDFAQAIGLCVTKQLVYKSLTGVARSSTECLGIHLGDPQTANLGDGNGNVAQTMELREKLLIGGTVHVQKAWSVETIHECSVRTEASITLARYS